MSVNIKKVIPTNPKTIIVALIFIALIGYLACPLDIQLEPVDWWQEYDMIFYSDNYLTNQYTKDADFIEYVALSGTGLKGIGTGQMYGRLKYTFTTDWKIEKGRLGVIAESTSQTCAIDIYINNQLAGSFNGSKEMLFCHPDYLPEGDDPDQWTIIPDPHKVEIKLIFYSNSANGPKDLILRLMEFSARVHGDAPDIEEFNGSLIGYVINSSNNAKISGATVSLGDRSTVTNSQGYYEINNIKPKTYTVKAEKTGYVSTENTVTISPCPGDTGCNQLDIYMSPSVTSTSSSSTRLEGYITHTNTENPIEGCAVVLCLQMSEIYSAETNEQGYYKITDIVPKTYSLKALAKNCQPHIAEITIVNSHRYDIEMGEGVSYPILPGRGFTETEEGTDYNYYPPVPPDYPTYVPRIREYAGANYPSEGPIYQNNTQSAPSDGADYVPPPPGYQRSSSLEGSGLNSPPQGGVAGALGQSMKGWERLIEKGLDLLRRLFK